MLRAFHRVFIFIGKNMSKMTESGTSSNLSRRALLVAGLAGALLGSSATMAGPATSVPTGNYKILITGGYTGDGTAVVSPASVSITGTVKNDQGISGTFTVTCTLDGDHFRGSGSLMGRGGNFTVQGRVEAKDPTQDPNGVVTDARIGATYVETFNGAVIHGGRLSGARQ